MAANSAGMMAKYLATSLAIEEGGEERPEEIEELLADLDNLDELGRVGVEVDHVAGSLAATVPVFMATPTSAWAKAGASLVPSPVMAISLPPPCSARISSIFRSGVAQARKSSTPASLAMAAAVSGLSPVIMTMRMPMRRSWSKRSRMPPLTMSLRWMTPRARSPSATTSRVPPPRAMSSTIGSKASPRTSTPTPHDPGDDSVGGSLADLAPVDVRPGHAGLGGEGDEPGPLLQQVAAAQAIALLGQDHDRAAFGCLVREEESCRPVGIQLGRVGARAGQLGRLPVAESDGAGLVQQQGVDVAGRLDGPARQGEHVVLDHPVHAGDADGRQQGADGGGDEADEQGDQHDHIGPLPGVDGERLEGHDRDQEDDGEHAEQDREGDLVGRLLPLGPLDEGDHLVEEALAPLGGDPHPDPVGQHPGPAGDGRAVPAGLADDRGRLAGDGRLVDRGDALDHLAVAGDDLAGVDRHLVARPGWEAGTTSVLPSERSRLAVVSRRALRSSSAWALPRPRPSPRRSWRTAP